MVERVGWRVSERREREKMKLMIVLMKKAGALKERVEEVFGKRCYVRKVNYERGWYFPLRRELGGVKLAENISVPEPKKEVQEIRVSGVIEIKCIEK